MKCHFCPRTRGDFRIGEFDLKLPRQRFDATDYILLLGDLSEVNEVVFCGYGESTEKINLLLDIAKYCKAHGATTRLNTNGHAAFYTRRDVVPDLGQVIDKISVSLNAQNEELYIKHCKPRLKGAYQMMLRFCKRCVEQGIDIQMSAIDGLEGVDIKECQRIAEELGAEFKYRKLNVMLNKE